ncbi:MAG: 3-hydroxyacyl-CoA dehydrogenase NAD-binding domain-containing protein, partial [Giesbergeria sp.]
MKNHSFSTVGVVGAGAMGRGIAQLAAQANCRVLLLDAQPGAAEAARGTVVAYWQQALARERISAAQASAWAAQLQAVDSPAALAGCDLVIEAIVERTDAKQALFAELEALLPAQAVLVTNTSSLSVTALAARLQRPERFAGLHFFNPAPQMKVVEIVPGLRTDLAVCERLD